MKKPYIFFNHDPGSPRSYLGMFGKNTQTPNRAEFVSVGPDGRFHIGDSIYNYVGTNFWYGAILASEGRGGDRQRLARELDLLQSLGIDNLRILAGGDGDENIPSHIMPVLQTAPGVYNDTILDGLDYLMAELERRDMKAVIYLNNAWEWSGGYGTYLEWAGEGRTPNPAIDGYQAYMDHVARFVHCDSAKALAAQHVKNIVTRTNRYTGHPLHRIARPNGMADRQRTTRFRIRQPHQAGIRRVDSLSGSSYKESRQQPPRFHRQ